MSEVRDWELMFRLKQNDWIEVCQELDSALAELKEAREAIADCLTVIAEDSPAVTMPHAEATLARIDKFLEQSK